MLFSSSQFHATPQGPARFSKAFLERIVLGTAPAVSPNPPAISAGVGHRLPARNIALPIQELNHNAFSRSCTRDPRPWVWLFPRGILCFTPKNSTMSGVSFKNCGCWSICLVPPPISSGRVKGKNDLPKCEVAVQFSAKSRNVRDSADHQRRRPWSNRPRE